MSQNLQSVRVGTCCSATQIAFILSFLSIWHFLYKPQVFKKYILYSAAQIIFNTIQVGILEYKK